MFFTCFCCFSDLHFYKLVFSVLPGSLSQAMAVLKLDLGKQEVHLVGVSSLNLGHKIACFDAVSAGHSTESSGQSGTNGSGVLSSG